MTVSRGSALYQRLRLFRNVAIAKAKRLRHLHPTSYVCATARVHSDLRTEEYVFVGPRCTLDTPQISIGRHTLLAQGVAIVGDDHPIHNPRIPMQFAGRPPSKTTTIGRDVWLGRDVLIMSGVTVGDGSVVAARSVVTKDIPAREIWAGVPARKIRDRFEKDTDNREHEAMVERADAQPVFAEPLA